MEISQELENLYNSYSEEIRKLLKHPKYQTDEFIHEGPFLISPWDDDYQNSEYKIMIIGKQTDGWTWEENTDIETSRLIDKSIKQYQTYKNGSEDTGRMFWKAFYKIISGLQENPNRLSAIWNNLWKFDQYNHSNHIVSPPNPEFRNAIIEEFNILQQEIEICKPGAVIFFTSKHFDYDLERQLNGITHSAFNSDYSIGEFSICSHPSLPNKSYRTYHPDYLLHWRPKSKSERYSKIIDLIINDIKKG